jgi:hypothetical protein
MVVLTVVPLALPCTALDSPVATHMRHLRVPSALRRPSN